MNVFNALAFESDNEEELMESTRPTTQTKEEISAMLIARRREKRRLRKAKAKRKSIISKIRMFLTLFIQAIFCWIFHLWMKAQKKDAEKFEETIKMLKERLEKLESQERPSATLAVPSQPQVPQQPPAASDPNNEITEKYKKMLSVGVPEMAVRQKMLKDGVDPKLLFPAMEIEKVALQAIKKANVKAVESSDSSLSRTPAPRGLNITVSALQDIRGSLRKTGSTRDSFENSENKENPQPFAISAAKIQEIRSNLKKTATKTPMDGRYRASPGMRDITNIDSAPRTPYVKKVIQSPSTARSDGEFLHLALLRKFQNVDSPSDTRY